MAQEIADSKLIDTWSSGGLKVMPDISKIIEGWQLGEQPPHEYMNWLQNTFGSKLNHILKNGVASWNNTTQYLAGSSVQHNGNVWLCKTTNTNSEPADVNANWKRIITVESLTTVLGGYITLTGDQTIAGVKTFSLSPIVPTPTTDPQAVNKYYADSKVALASFMGANQSLALSGYQKLPGGLIIQWGNTANITDGNGNFQITYPITFPTSQLSCIFSLGEKIAPEYPSSLALSNNAGEFGKSSMNINITNYQNINAVGAMIRINWLVIGY